MNTINDANNTGKQISFQYYDFIGLKKKVFKNNGEVVYKLSPYKLLWSGDYYYIIGWVFGFGGKVQILAPEIIKEKYKQMIQKANEDIIVKRIIRCLYTSKDW